MGLLHEKLTYTLRGCFYDVHNELGIGYDEETYQLALEERLKKENISFQSKVVKYVEHRGKKVHKFVADLIIANKIILELKNLQTDFHPANYLQTLSYLKCWQKDLGLLVNFGTSSVKVKRIPFTEKKATFIEDYSELKKVITPDNRVYLKALRDSILAVFEVHGLGYDDVVYKALLNSELTYRNIPFVPQILIPVNYDHKIIRHFELKSPVINHQILCRVFAIKENLQSDMFKIENYLKATNIPIGLIAHFGKEELEILGTRVYS